MKPPCDEVLIKSVKAAAPCSEGAGPWILAATILASSMAFIDSTVVNVALPALQAGFQATVVDVQWVVESYGLLLGTLILVGGSLGDLFGRRLIFVIGVAIFAAASAGCSLASTIHHLVIARSIQGVGAAFLVPGSLSIISATFDERSRGQAIGTWSGFTAITTAIGPVLGGWLIEHASWRWAFLINIPLAAIVIAVSLWRIPESRSAGGGHIDWWGTLAATIGLGGLITGFIESVNLGWTHPLVFGSLTLGFSALTAFGFLEGQVSSPLVPLALFQSRSFRGANLLTLFLYAALGIFFFLFPLNLIQVQGYSATQAGAAALPLILLMFLLSRWSGGLVTRYGPRTPLIIGPLIAASGFILFAVPAVGDSYWNTFFPAFVVLGFGMAVSVAPLTTVVMSSVDEDRVGTASGINNAVARVAGVLAIAVLGIVMVHAFSYRLNRSLAKLPLPAGVLHRIQSNEIKLAGLELPEGLDASATATIRASLSQAFVFGFRVVMLICAGLSLASAAVVWLMTPVKTEKSALLNRTSTEKTAVGPSEDVLFWKDSSSRVSSPAACQKLMSRHLARRPVESLPLGTKDLSNLTIDTRGIAGSAVNEFDPLLAGAVQLGLGQQVGGLHNRLYRIAQIMGEAAQLGIHFRRDLGSLFGRRFHIGLWQHNRTPARAESSVDGLAFRAGRGRNAMLCFIGVRLQPKRCLWCRLYCRRGQSAAAV